MTEGNHKGRAEVTRGGEVVGTVRYTVHVDAWGHVTGNVRDVEWLITPTEGPRILNSSVVSQDFLPKGPQDPKLRMVLENGTRVEFWVPSTNGQIADGRVVDDEPSGNDDEGE